MKKIWILGIALLSVLCLAGCKEKNDRENGARTEELAETETEDLIRIGFSQLGAESDWRTANTNSMTETFSEENGFELLMENGQQKQTNQFTAIRTFIQQEVDYIVLAPVTEDGWDTVLEEAREANIPVIIMDRKVDVEDDSLFRCWVGSDFELEGKKVAQWLHAFAEEKGIAPSDLHIVNIQGTIGASAQIGRTKGLQAASGLYGWDLMAEMTGDFTQAKGREVMTTLLEQYDNINVVYCENDNSALGAIEAIEAAGKTCGMDLEAGEIMVISFDGVKEEAMDDVREGRIACIAECNPHQGPRVLEVIRQMEAGEEPEKYSYVEEEIYSSVESIPEIKVNDVVYPVSITK
ncbi:MAG: ABC transporter substrate-binding protein [Blautia sp.]|nr:ABC transporter substrate-binding protein [Blautia sp.]